MKIDANREEEFYLDLMGFVEKWGFEFIMPNEEHDDIKQILIDFDRMQIIGEPDFSYGFEDMFVKEIERRRSEKDTKIKTYKGFDGSNEYSEEDVCCHGKILNIQSVCSYDNSAGSIQEAFEEAVDEYLDFAERKKLFS